ncbi:MAG: ParA family protein [Haloarculaceae archaeon]
MPDPARLAVSNQKGGVGKTAVAINVAGALNRRGADVLFVDLDPQGNATENLGMRSLYDEGPPSLFDVLSKPEYRERVSELIREHEEMDLLPSNIDMTAVEPELTLSRRSGQQLSLALDHLDYDYDYVVIDCPPFLGNLMDNALYAAQNTLIPALAETTSKRAFELLFDHVRALQKDYDIDISDCGVVINRIDVRKTQAQEMIDWIDNAFDDTPVWKVRDRAAIQRALASGASLFSEEPNCDQIAVFEEIAESLEHQLQRAEVSP